MVVYLTIWENLSIYDISANIFLIIGIILLLLKQRFEAVLFILTSIFFLILLGFFSWQIFIILCVFFSFYVILAQFDISNALFIFLTLFLTILFWNLTIFLLIGYQKLSAIFIIYLLGSAFYTSFLVILIHYFIKVLKKKNEQI